MDKDIIDSTDSMQGAEKELGHKMTTAKEKEAAASLAQVDLGVDADIMRV